MTKIRNEKPLDDSAHELLVAEEELILHAQMLIQRVLNERGMSQKALAEKLGLGESYVSQMLGTSARNLTLRTIARVLKALDVKATLVLDDHVEATAEVEAVVAVGEADGAEAKAAATRIAASQLSQVWGEIVTLPPRKKANRRHEADAEAYASYDPPVREMEMEMALAA